MKKLIQIFTIAALPFWLGSCGQDGGHDHPHEGHGHDHGHDHGHGNEAPPEEVTLATNMFKQHDIRVEGVGRQTLQPTFQVPARVTFNQETTAHIGTLVNGRVIEMNTRLGDIVKKDDVLFTIESPDLGLAQNEYLKANDSRAIAKLAITLAENNAGTAKAQAELDAATAALMLAKNNASVVKAQAALEAATPVLKRARELFESGKKLAASGALATTELKRRETSMQTATAEIKAAEGSLALAQAQQERDIEVAQGKITAATAGIKAAQAQQAKDLGEAKSALNIAASGVSTAINQLTLYGMTQDAIAKLLETRDLSPHYQVRAPRAGTIVEREVTLGENTRADQSHLLILADLSKVWVIIDVPTASSEFLVKGNSVNLRTDATGYQTSASLDYISPTVDPETRSVQARVEMDNPDGRWRPGQFLTALLPTGGATRETLVVPESAVQYIDGKPTVYQEQKKKNTFRQVTITAGATVGGWVPVTGGLKENAKIVTQGSFVLKAEFGKAKAGHDHSH